MPTRDNERWIKEGDIMTGIFDDAGYETEVQFANNDVPTQVNQIENLIAKGVKALVISSVDGSALTSVLEDAEAQDIPVFAYTRLITDTTAVSYYATFDYYFNGKDNATAVLQGLGVLDAEGNPTDVKGPFNIEIVNGSPTDNVTQYMYKGAFDVFQPFIDDGVITIRSGQTTFEQTVTPNWDGELAQSRVEDILAAHYADNAHLDAVWTPYDGLSRGIISALQGAGYTVGSDWSIVTGGNAELDSVKAILAGEQYSSSFDDWRDLAKATGDLVVDVLDDGETDVELNTEDYDNGAKVVPTMLFGLRNVTKADVEPVLVESGFYTADQLGL
ncbi:sugar ABC transporter substrate-binding protein [Amnibacterium flavum]|uniref:Sugar ABC transporter substrate-binding protein n=2 Tax=Amnibacterium flavum TaxID=2173173 RepID=A0A2V1HKY7_9MICO|nr:sugar ABC transporter substrate-binding protein [Amnibacterium flavum]